MPRSLVLLATCSVVFFASVASNAGAHQVPLGFPFADPAASTSGTCSGPGTAAFSAPVTGDHPETFVRVTTTGGPGVVTVAGDGQAFAAGDQTLRPYPGPLTSGDLVKGSLECPAANVDYTVEVYDDPSTSGYSVSLNGMRSPLGAGDYDSFDYRVADTAPYTVGVIVQQGSVEVRSRNPAHAYPTSRYRSSTGEISRRFSAIKDSNDVQNMELGTLYPGISHLDIKPLPGPRAIYNVQVRRLGVTMWDWERDRQYVDPGQSITESFFLDGDVELSASIRTERGRQVLRTLVPSQPYGVGRHTIHWDGRDSDGQPLADGIYVFDIEFHDTGGSADSSHGRFWVDHKAPSVTMATRRLSSAARHVDVGVHDSVAGVKRAAMSVDGHRVASLPARRSRISYKPRRGWRAGPHTVTVVATDRAGNTRRLVRRISVAQPHRR